MPQKQDQSNHPSLMEMQSQFMEELAAPLRPYTRAMLDQGNELAKIQEAAISQVHV